jgi:protease I
MNTFKQGIMAAAVAAAFAMIAASAPVGASDTAPSHIRDGAVHAPSAAHGDLLRFLMQPVTNSEEFKGKRVAIVLTEGASAFELETTRDYFMDRGARVHILTPRPVARAYTIGLANSVPPTEVLSTLDYAGQQRLVAVTWYLDQVRPEDYDAIYVPNNLRDMQGLRTSSQAIRFLLGASAAARPIFVTGNGKTVVPGLAFALDVQSDGGALLEAVQAGKVYVGQDAYDMPKLIEVLAVSLAGQASAEAN